MQSVIKSRPGKWRSSHSSIRMVALFTRPSPRRTSIGFWMLRKHGLSVSGLVMRALA